MLKDGMDSRYESTAKRNARKNRRRLAKAWEESEEGERLRITRNLGPSGTRSRDPLAAAALRRDLRTPDPVSSGRRSVASEFAPTASSSPVHYRGQARHPSTPPRTPPFGPSSIPLPSSTTAKTLATTAEQESPSAALSGAANSDALTQHPRRVLSDVSLSLKPKAATPRRSNLVYRNPAQATRLIKQQALKGSWRACSFQSCQRRLNEPMSSRRLAHQWMTLLIARSLRTRTPPKPPKLTRLRTAPAKRVRSSSCSWKI